MRNRCIFLFVLWIVMFIASAQQEYVSTKEASTDAESFIIEGRVVNSSGIPIKDVYVKGLTTNISVVTGNDGLFSLKLPVKDDSVAFVKPGMATFCETLFSNYKIVILLGPEKSTWMPYLEYAEKMQPTSKVYYEAGLKYFAGESGNAPDIMKAYACFSRAANMENSDAAFRLAKMYDEGLGITQDYAKAISWYKNSTKIAEANTRLGVMYSEGLGVQQDYLTAARYFYSAEKLGDSIVASKKLKEIFEKNLAKKEDVCIFDIVEVNAEFPGGHDECMKWLKEHIKYPKDCIEQGIQGRVIASFVVEKNGSIVDLKITRSPHPSLSKEVVRLLTLMPKWEPAKQGGKTVRQRYNLPVNFNLGK